MMSIISTNLYLLFAAATLVFNASHVISSSSKSTYALSLCSNLDVDSTSYARNLKTLFSNLKQSAAESTNNGYNATDTSDYSSAVGTETIYGLFLCNGDITTTECSDCVFDAIHKVITECPDDKGAVIWFDKCMVRYSNQSFLGGYDETVNNLYYKSQEDVDVDKQRYMTVAGNELKSLANELSATNSATSMEGGKKYFRYSNSSVNSFVTVYTIAQCTPDLSPINCGKCLSVIIAAIPNYCNGSKGCRMLNPTCVVRYEGYPIIENAEPPSSLPREIAAPIPPPLQVVSGDANRAPSSSKRDKGHESLWLKIALGSLVLLLLVLVAAFILLLCKKQATPRNEFGMMTMRGKETQATKLDHGEEATTVESLQYDFATLEVATDKFSKQNKIGEGGFGDVFKGTLRNGKEIAVKRLSKGSEQGLEQFKNEVVLIAKLQHRNLVQIMGFCLTSDEMLLVYELVCNKSLDLILFDPKMQGQLGWSTRYKIINGIARGLSYIHEDSRHKVVHRDLKASNVLLDADMNPKIADFGLARKFSATDQLEEHTLRLAGTRGYMAPEYIEYGAISTKSDVYSFGVLVLEIISGKKISDRQTGLAKNLLAYAWKHWNEDTISSFVDASVGDSYCVTEVKRCVHLGLLCVQGDTDQRPSMIKVISYLNGDVDLPIPQQPSFIASVRMESSSGTGTGTGTGTGEFDSHKSNKSGSSSRTTRSQSSLP